MPRFLFAVGFLSLLAVGWSDAFAARCLLPGAEVWAIGTATVTECDLSGGAAFFQGTNPNETVFESLAGSPVVPPEGPTDEAAEVLYLYSWGMGAVLSMWAIGYAVGIAVSVIKQA